MKEGTKLGKTLIALYLIVVIATVIFAVGFRISVEEDKAYYSKEEVALYLYTFKKLPSNFIPLSQLDSENLRPSDTNLIIGGSVFEYSGEITNHTTNKNLYQADIYDIHSQSLLRGEMRLVYTADYSEVFFTEDNFVSFKSIKKNEINNLSDGLWITFACLLGVFIVLMIICYNLENLKTWKNDFQQIFGAIYIFIISIVMVPMYFIFRMLKALKRIIVGQ